MSPEYALTLEIAKFVVSLFTFASVLVAFFAYRANLRKQDEDRVREADKELLAQAQKSLEWAYNSLTNNGTDIPPNAARLNWLTSARHLLRHRKIASSIKSGTYKTVHAEHEEYWRHQFYLALDHSTLRDTDYFSNLETPAWPVNIEVSSALVVVGFSNWPRQLKDPTDEVNQAELLKDIEALKGKAGRGLRDYVALLSEANVRMKANADEKLQEKSYRKLAESTGV